MGGGDEQVAALNTWGNALTTTGRMASTLGELNPLRYRGYVYDTETGLYYLQSRYYNPEWGRFINADGLVSTGQGLLGNNMFAYCNNSPVLFSDPTGNIHEYVRLNDYASCVAIIGVNVGLAAAGIAVLNNIADLFATTIDKLSGALIDFSRQRAAEKEKAQAKAEVIAKTSDQNYNYWSAAIIDGIVTPISPLTYSEARVWVDCGFNLLCRNHAAAIAIVKFYPSAIWEPKHCRYDDCYLNHYHLSSAHTNHIWYLGE